MEYEEIKHSVKKMIFELESPPESPVLNGTTEITIKQFENETGMILPKDVKEWLLFSNGSLVAPGGVYGLNNGEKYYSIEGEYEYNPNWLKYQWLPIAGDGCGNRYVIDINPFSKSKGFVFFIDTMSSVDKPEFVVASNIWYFLYFLFTDELKRIKWPFNKKEVVEIDPNLEKCKDWPLPWD